MYKRILPIILPARQSIFLWGARQTGKSTFLRQRFQGSFFIDLLQTDEIIRYIRSPALLREEVLALSAEELKQPIIIDEIQKVPHLLNEVHWLIEHTQAQFILCGSSARQLKTASTNLLGGRAWVYYFLPLVYAEIPHFNLLQALQHGLIPTHYQAEKTYIEDKLQAYVNIYMAEEIRNEGLVRNLAGFARFLDLAGLMNGEMINLSNIARDAGVDRHSIKGYYQILIDTLLGYEVYPYHEKIKRDLISATPKFYFFDVGVANYLAKQTVTELVGYAAGKSFEHYIFMELTAYRAYHRKKLDITYWRTKSGLEVDFIIGQALVAIEVKLSEQVHKEDLKGLIAFSEEHPNAQAIVVSRDKRERKLLLTNDRMITILPWEKFLQALWAGDVF